MRKLLQEYRARWDEERRIRKGYYLREAYSQEGEDLLLVRLLGEKRTGFYVDVGAHHPMRFSNTYLFYRMGWSGINIDPLPGVMDLFKRHRPRDINLELGISDKVQNLTYYMWNEPALNSFDEKHVLKVQTESPRYRIVGEKYIRTAPLSDVLTQHLPPSVDVDFLSVDCEGLDYQVLLSNDWSRFRPRFVVVELPDLDLVSSNDSPSFCLLKREGYQLIAKTLNSCFFRRLE